MTLVRATGQVGAPADRVFGFLADLDRHRALTDGGIQILDLDGPAGARTGGTVELRGPAGLTRRARTHVEGADDHGRRLWGRAVTEHGTEAELEWSLAPRRHGTAVTVQMRVRPRHWPDRLLLRLGGRRWLVRRLAAAIGRLGALSR
ncbi:MAG TPA: SRPBCC family protein [Thermoleophilaceae bacterium]|jgi:hypothetical protein